MTDTRSTATVLPLSLPPIWLMGFGYLPMGIFFTTMALTVPQLLAAQHVAEPDIASMMAIILIPGFGGFLLAPLLDWRFSRRAYAITFSVIAALCLFAALLSTGNLPLLTGLLFAGYLAITLQAAAVGGWFGNLTPAADKGRLGAWFTVANLGSGGLLAMVAMVLLRELPYTLGAALIAVLILAVIPLLLRIPCPPADSRLASESFRDFARDVLSLLRQRTVLGTLVMFLLPAASFSLTNMLGGLGDDFHTSEKMVGLIGGAGAAVAGVVGSLLIPGISRRVRSRWLYLLVGFVGALFTLALTQLARSPATFGLAMLGENAFQAAAFSVENFVILETIGHDNPLAATQFALLSAATSLPISYMQELDGRGYAAGGVNGSFTTDALISGCACLLLAAVFWLLRRKSAPAGRAA